jgi:hypothetical protein
MSVARSLVLVATLWLAQTVCAESYNLWVCGTQVTDANASNLATISGVEGTVSYDAGSKTLTLRNATLSTTGGNNYSIRVKGIDGFTLHVEGTNTVTSEDAGIYFDKSQSIVIEGGGTLNVIATSEVYSCYDIFYAGPLTNHTLTIRDCTVNLLGGGGLDNNGDNDEKLIIDHADFFTKAGSHSGLCMMELEMIGCTQVMPSPDEYVWKGLFFYKDGWTTQWMGDISIVGGTPVPIDATRFPDDNFRNHLLAQDYGRDGVLSDRELEATLSMKVSSKGIKSLEGLQTFRRLWGLECNKNELTSLDVLEQMNVQTLKCSDNQLTGLPSKVTKSINTLECRNNKITALDVAGNQNLATLLCNGNQLTTLDLTNMPNLSWLDCADNQLTSLSVSEIPLLSYLWCQGNQLTSLDVSGHTPLQVVDMSHNPLTTANLSGCTRLTEVNCSRCKITGDDRDAFFDNLPAVTNGTLKYLYETEGDEGNTINQACINKAKRQGWKVMYGNWWDDWHELTQTPNYIAIDAQHFPDAQLRNWMLQQWFGTDGQLSEMELPTIRSIDVTGLGITDMTGIELFTNLYELYCSVNSIRGDQMENLVFGLPEAYRGELYVYDATNDAEHNLCSSTLVRLATTKGWIVYCRTADGWTRYYGEKLSYGIKGDVNDDGQVGIGDIVSITNIMAGKSEE